MSNLSRSTALKIAAVIALVLALINLVVYDIPFLAIGRAALNQAASTSGGPEFSDVMLGFTFTILAFVAAYGTWRAERWGVILMIVVSAYNCFNNTLAAIFAPWVATQIFATVSVILYLGVIYFCLRREPESLTESV